MPRQPNPQAEELKMYKILAYGLALVLFVVFAGVGFLSHQEATQQKELDLYHNLGATYYTNGSVYVRFNVMDLNQLKLVHDIEAICQHYNFKTCMNANDRLAP